MKTFRRIILFGGILFLPALSLAEEIQDPFEKFNRGIFWFNMQLDECILEPIATGYNKGTPNFLQKGVTNFFENLRYPIYLVSDILQLKFGQVAQHTGRFVLNSTAGIAGLIDVAEDIGLEEHYEDFGTALGYWGVPSGPYLVLPFLGPSNVRDAVGRIVDGLLSPLYYVNYTDASRDTKLAVTLGLKTIEVVDERARLLGAIKSAKESSLDFYLFTQSSYMQIRENHIHDGREGEDEFDDELDDEFDFEDELED